MREAMLYEKLDNRRVRCRLCAHYCVIADGKRGVCNVRENRGGILYTLVYGRTISRAIDPIEKKPFFHFYPGSHSFSIATPGCNMHCEWCQNWQISQQSGTEDLAAGTLMSADEIVAAAAATACRSIAYTYTEPTIFFEYSYETARRARDAGLANLYVSNGYMSAEMLEMMTPWLDGANIDLKGFSNKSYQKYSGAQLQPVLDSLIALQRAGIWLEVTTLIIPGINDDPHELTELASFIATNLSPEVPWHVSRFSPQYRLRHLPPTPLETLDLAVSIGHEAGLHYVYPGNLAGEVSTCCPGCGETLIERRGFTVIANRVTDRGSCPKCGCSIAGVGVAG
jgi:pyruvate formate lyase activating enzyme